MGDFSGFLDLIGVSVVKRVIFCNNAKGFHRVFFLLKIYNLPVGVGLVRFVGVAVSCVHFFIIQKRMNITTYITK